MSDRRRGPTPVLPRPVRVGPWLSLDLSGPVGADGERVVPGGVERQAERSIRRAKAALRRAGARWEDVVRLRVLLADIDDRVAVESVLDRTCRKSRPAISILGVALPDPDWRVAVEVDAVMQMPSLRRGAGSEA